jgi:hypothetical protein
MLRILGLTKNKFLQEKNLAKTFIWYENKMRLFNNRHPTRNGVTEGSETRERSQTSQSQRLFTSKSEKHFDIKGRTLHNEIPPAKDRIQKYQRNMPNSHLSINSDEEDS